MTILDQKSVFHNHRMSMISENSQKFQGAQSSGASRRSNQHKAMEMEMAIPIIAWVLYSQKLTLKYFLFNFPTSQHKV